MIKFETHENVAHILSPEGAQIVNEGSHEARVWAALPAQGKGAPVTPAQLKKQVGEETSKVGQGRAFKNGWIGKDGAGLVKLVRSYHSAGSRQFPNFWMHGIRFLKFKIPHEQTYKRSRPQEY